MEPKFKIGEIVEHKLKSVTGYDRKGVVLQRKQDVDTKRFMYVLRVEHQDANGHAALLYVDVDQEELIGG